MKTLFRLLYVATIFTFVACVREVEGQKSDEIWIKVCDEESALYPNNIIETISWTDFDGSKREVVHKGNYTKKGEWFVIKMADDDVKNGYVLSEASIRKNPTFKDEGYRYITEVQLPSSITKIDEFAFDRFRNLERVNIPSSVEVIERYAFWECTSLTSIEIPEGVHEIKKGTFRNCSKLEQINIPSSIEVIEDEAFLECYSLTNIEIPEGVRMVGERAFYRCSSLESITIPFSVKKIGREAFKGCCMPFAIIPSNVRVDNAFDSDVIIKRKYR